MKHTETYQLNQWEKTDRIQMEDFNSDNARVEAALAEQADDLAVLRQMCASLGNCKIVYGSYAGSGQLGKEHPNILTFDAPPLAVLIGSSTFLVRGTSRYSSDPQYPKATSYVTWAENSVSWYNTDSTSWQYSSAGSTYYYVALLAAE